MQPTRKLMRRDFIKAGLTALGGLMLFGCRSRPVPLPRTLPTPTKESIVPASVSALSTTRAPIYTDSSYPLAERVDDLLARMTLEEKISQMGSEAPAIERLEIPQYNWWNEALHGVARAGIATVFPQAIGLASTWNSELMYRIAQAISDEGRAKHHQALRGGLRDPYAGLTFWSPNINIFRDPRWGAWPRNLWRRPPPDSPYGRAVHPGPAGR